MISEIPAQVVDRIKNASNSNVAETETETNSYNDGSNNSNPSGYNPNSGGSTIFYGEDEADMETGFFRNLFGSGEEDESEPEDTYFEDEGEYEEFISEPASLENYETQEAKFGLGEKRENAEVLLSDSILEIRIRGRKDRAREKARRGCPDGFNGELRLQGVLSSKYGVVIPRARFGWQFLQTELRYNQIIEPGIGYRASYRTLDWQVLRLRVLLSGWLDLSVGGGFSYEEYQNLTHPEMTIEIGLNLLDGDLFIPLEGRFSYTSNGSTVFRHELGLSLNYRLADFSHSRLFLSTGYVYENYFNEVDIHGVLAGFRLAFF